MNKQIVITVVALLGTGVGYAIRDAELGKPVRAAAEQPRLQVDADKPAIGRFQIAAFSSTETGAGHGYYVLDTATGETWLNYKSNRSAKLADPLLE